MHGRGASPAARLGLSPTQALLLQASLLTGDPALRAWQGWREAADIEVLEPGAYALMPSLYQNLTRLGVDDPLVSILKGFTRGPGWSTRWPANGWGKSCRPSPPRA